ncbi:MAG: hypothetical protein NZ578_07455 [Candidatus Binatia bacterium]|nr:hypothetical protein [Candidatus Binatia bacterium]
MFPQAGLLSGVPSGALDMTAAFAPLLQGMVIGLGLCVLGLLLSIGVYDTWRARHETVETPAQSTSLPKAA